MLLQSYRITPSYEIHCDSLSRVQIPRKPPVALKPCEVKPLVYGVAGTQRRHATRCYAVDDDDIELAVFRFTLGIPGFDDALIPRVVGVLGACVLALNHVVSGEVSQSQSFTEVLGFILAGVGIAAPDLQRKIEDSTPGKGRKAPLENIEGAENVFAISEDLSEDQKQEAAWASYAIIKNANVCGICIHMDTSYSSIVCRGSLGKDVSGDSCLEKAGVEVSRIGMKNVFVYLDTRSSIDSSPYKACLIIPKGAGGVASIPIVPIDADEDQPALGRMILVCDRERALSAKELAWCRSVASKLYHVMYTYS